MINPDKPKSGTAIFIAAAQTLASVKGNILVYLVIVFLIFGVLGITIVSLFKTTTTSTAIPNDTRRAYYMREAGMRYAMSEMRNSKFSPSAIEKLNTTTYKPAPNHNFTINVFSPWYEASAEYNFTSGGIISLKVPQGKLPENYTVPAGVWAINFNYTSLKASLTTERDRVTGFSIDLANNRLDLILSDDFIANENEPVCLAVQISGDQADMQLTEGEDLYVAMEARDIFPKHDGAVSIQRRNYTYETRVDEPGANRVKLQNLKASTVTNRETPFPLDITKGSGGIYDGDWVILSPLNYVVIPTGKAGDVTVPGSLEDAVNVFDPTTVNPMSRAHIDAEELTSNFEAIDDSDFLKVDTFDNTIDVGGGAAGSDFGGGWYNASKSIGGNADFCIQGRCTTNLGFRVFFTLEYSGDGDGLTFALINGEDNSIFSAGGDIELSELIGYGGDSRTVADGSAYLADSAENRGLDPPKIALEFDMHPNNASTIYCNGSAANLHTRNDPLSGQKDAVQYVFWRQDSTIEIAAECSREHPSYDDNRHGPVEWRFEGSSSADNFSFGRPAVGSDHAIYVSTRDDPSADEGKLYAINRNGREKWSGSTDLGDNSDYMPGIDPADDTLFIDVNNNKLRAINPSDGNPITGFAAWPGGELAVGGDVESTPVVDDGRTLYFSTYWNNAVEIESGQIIAATLAAGIEWEYPTSTDPGIGSARTTPALSNDQSVVYTLATDDKTRALNTATGTVNWSSVADIENRRRNHTALVSSPTVDPGDGTIYVGSQYTDDRLFAVNPSGTTKWTYSAGGSVNSTPAVDQTIGGVGAIYAGSDDNFLHAVYRGGANMGDLKWKFPDPMVFPIGTGANIWSSPAVDGSRGTIYFGSDNEKFYAVNPDGTEMWSFDTGGKVRSSPAIGADGNIYVGSDRDDSDTPVTDAAFYAFVPFNGPQNKGDFYNKAAGNEDAYITSKFVSPNNTVAGEIVELDSSDDWLKGAPANPGVGPWAVRLEVLRSTTANPAGNYEYTLRTWLRQCDTTCSAILGTYFEDTRVEYNAKTPHLTQTFELTAAEHSKFSTFLFGFTGAVASGESQTAIIDRFKLSFIGADDQIIISDPSWP